MLWVDHLGGDYQLTLGSNGLSGYLDSGQTPTAGQWQYLSATYDGSTARFYIDGTQVASRSVTGSRRELERLADRRLRLARGRLLRRPARQRAHLQQGAERDRGADGHELARRRLGCTERPAGALGADGQREDANVDFPAVGAFDGEQRLQRLPRRRTGRFAGRDDVHLLGSVVRDKPSARRRGLRLRRQRLRSHDAGRLDVALRRGSGTRRRLRLRRGLRHRPPRRLRQRPRRHHLRRHLDRRPRRRRALLQRQQRLCRPGHARHLLPERLHARGLGAKGGCEEGRRRRSAAGTGAGRCSGSTTWAATTSSRSAATASPATSTRARPRPPGNGST